MTIENTLRIELLFVDIEIVKRLVKQFKILFNQESIAVEETEVNSVLM